jgi:hypothetical protein
MRNLDVAAYDALPTDDHWNTIVPLDGVFSEKILGSTSHKDALSAWSPTDMNQLKAHSTTHGMVGKKLVQLMCIASDTSSKIS